MSVSINYHREGSGPPLVLLHGVGHHWQAWRPVIELLAGEFDVVACDSPGFGRSGALAAGIDPTIPAYADAFEWFFAELGLQRPHVAGNSMGGGIALELARRRAIRSACAFSPVGFWSAPELRFCQLSLKLIQAVPVSLRPAVEALTRTRAGRIAVLGQLYGFPSRVPVEEALSSLRDAWSAPAMSATLDAFAGYRFENAPELRNVPVTIAWGRYDRLLPYRLQAPRARRMLPQARHVTLTAGHLPFHDDPHAVAAAIRASAAAASGERSAPQGATGQ